MGTSLGECLSQDWLRLAAAGSKKKTTVGPIGDGTIYLRHFIKTPHLSEDEAVVFYIS